jgi:head-tail adaptor
MIDTSKPFVRLETSLAAKKAHKKAAAEAKDQTIKLAVRLTEGINEALRSLIRYRGDLSIMALEALDAIDLTRVALVSVEERMVRDTTITMPRVLHKKVKKIADDRESSMNILVNTALAHWLARKGALRLG